MDFSTLLVHLEVGASNDGLLQTAADLAKRFHAHVIGVAVCKAPSSAYLALLPQYGVDNYEDIVEINGQQIQEKIAATERQFRKVLEHHGLSLEWRSAITEYSPAEYVITQARAADLLLMNASAGVPQVDQRQHLSIGDILLSAGRPMLLTPKNTACLDFDRIMIGWNESRETRRAIADALPLLKLAKEVFVVEITATQSFPEAKRHLGEVIAWLSRHGVSATARIEGYRGIQAGQLDIIAREIDAGLLVAGGFSHTPLRESIIGGVTMDVLLRPKRPTFVSH